MAAKYAVASEDNYEIFDTMQEAVDFAVSEKGTVTIWKRIGKLKLNKDKK